MVEVYYWQQKFSGCGKLIQDLFVFLSFYIPDFQ